MLRAAATTSARRSEATRRRFVRRIRLTRREVIGWGIGAGLSLYAASALPISRALEAAGADAAAAPDAPVLVTVFLPGGLDLLDTLVPLHDYGAYADLHANIRVAEPALLRGSAMGIHPSLTQGAGGGIKGLYDAGKLGFLPGIDYPDPNLSHFHSRHFWETGLIIDSHRPAGWAAGWMRTAIATTRCRACRSGTGSRRSCARAPPRSPRRPRPATRSSGSAAPGASRSTRR